jgi:lambda family phage tail tape measure protein
MNKNVNFQIRAKDKTRAAFKRVLGGIKSITKSLFSFRAAIGVAVGVAGLGYLIKRSLDSIDNLGKLSKTLGISTKALATFEYMAELGGSTLAVFAKASKKMSKDVFDYVTRGVGEAADAFKALGIRVNDLKPIMNDSVAIMGLVSDGLNKMPDGAIKTALAYKLLGGRATELLPALAGGSAAFREAAKDAEVLGIALSQNAVAGVERANDAMTKFKFLLRGARDQLVSKFAPIIEKVTDLIRNKMIKGITKNGQTIESWAGDVANHIIDMAKKVVRAIAGMINGTAKILHGLKKGLGLLGKSEHDVASKALKNRRAEMKEISKTLMARQKLNKEEGLLAGGKKVISSINVFVRMSKSTKQLTAEYTAAQGQAAKLNETIQKLEKNGSKSSAYVPIISENAINSTDAYFESLKTVNKTLSDTAKTARNSFTETSTIINQSRDRLKDFSETAKDSFKSFQDVGMTAVNSLESALTNFVTTGKLSIKSLVNTIIADFARMAIRRHITGPLSGLLSGLIGGGFGSGGGGSLSNLVNPTAWGGGSSIGAFANGGRPPVGVPSLVGERGRELFVPDTAGTIIPNNRLSGMTAARTEIQITQNITLSPNTAPTVRAQVYEAAPEIAAAAAQMVMGQMQGISA